MRADRDIQEKFARQMQEEYRKTTPLPEFCNKRGVKERDKNLEFVQLGRRIPVPITVFEQGILEPTTGPFARSISKGEEKFFLTDLINAADDETIPSVEMNDLSTDAIGEAVNKLGVADTVFIPHADEYTTTVNDWLKNGTSLHGGTQLEVNSSTLDIRRFSPDFGIKDVVVTNSQEIDLVQKQAEETLPPKGLDVDETLTYLNDGQEFMVYFAENTESGQPDDQYDEYLDVVFRVVISQPLVNNRSAVRLKAPPNMELSSEND